MNTQIEETNSRVQMVQPLIGYVDGERVTVELAQLGSDFAKSYLEKLRVNRPENATNIRKLSNEINNNRYLFNGDAFRFDKNGNAADGAHTARAIIATGKSVPRLIVRGLDEAAFQTIDKGAKRKLSDDLSLSGIECSRDVAAAARLAYALESKPGQQPSLKDNTDTEILDYIKENNEIIEFAKLHGNERGLLLASSVISAFHFVFSKINKDLANTFIEKLINGANVEENDPVFLLRKVLIENITAKKRYKKFHVLAFIIKTWNSTRQQIPLKLLKYARVGKQAEAFPKII